MGGAAALLLAGIGLYAVLAFAVRQRIGEVAVRLTLGASSGRVSREFLREGALPGAAGLRIGLPLSLLALQVIIRAGGLSPPSRCCR